jgi:hypothetical protein
MFEAKGLRTVEDLLPVPFRYESQYMKPISQPAPGDGDSDCGSAVGQAGGLSPQDPGLFEAAFTDSSRATLLGKWFHGKYLAGSIVPGQSGCSEKVGTTRIRGLSTISRSRSDRRRRRRTSGAARRANRAVYEAVANSTKAHADPQHASNARAGRRPNSAAHQRAA